MADASSQQEKEPFGILLGKMLFTGAIGGVIVAMIFISTIYFGVYPSAPIKANTNYYIMGYNVGGSNSEDKLKLLVRDVVDKEIERVESRIRDHFTLLITLSGVAVTIIIGFFSFFQAKKGDNFLREIKEHKIETELIKQETYKIRDDANKVLDEIKICKKMYLKRPKVLNQKEVLKILRVIFQTKVIF